MGSKSRALREPDALRAGARIALVAPSGALGGPQDIERASANVRAMGWEPVVMPSVLERDGYFAGRDDQRAEDLSRAIADPSIDGIWCVRGGYGAMRLLERVDFSPLVHRAKALIGYSDITALHSVWNRMGIVSYHGPVARAELTDLARGSLERACVQRCDSAGTWPDARIVRGGMCRGRIAGGNLALVAALCGTPWAVRFAGAIAILEDVNEASYRVDRMLAQLRLAGAFDGCRGIVFGHFTDCSDASDSGARAVSDVIDDFVATIGVPAVSGMPLGHIADQWTYPIGAMAELNADERRLVIVRDV